MHPHPSTTKRHGDRDRIANRRIEALLDRAEREYFAAREAALVDGPSAAVQRLARALAAARELSRRMDRGIAPELSDVIELWRDLRDGAEAEHDFVLRIDALDGVLGRLGHAGARLARPCRRPLNDPSRPVG